MIKILNEIRISRQLKERRASLKLTRVQMAELIDIPFSVYSSYEEGRATPRVGKMIHIARALGYKSLDQFLGIEKTKSKPLGMALKYRKLSLEKKKIVDYILNSK